MATLEHLISNVEGWCRIVAFFEEPLCIITLASTERYFFFHLLDEQLRETRAAWVAFKLLEAEAQHARDEDDSGYLHARPIEESEPESYYEVPGLYSDSE